MPKKPEKRSCTVCGNEIGRNGPSRRTKYCSDMCAAVKTRSSLRGFSSGLSLASATVGAISEMTVCADLLARGYEVFRSVSPACGCDLVAYRDGVCVRVEVRTGKRYSNGNLCYPKGARGHYDVMAVVEALTPDGIWYSKPMD